MSIMLLELLLWGCLLLLFWAMKDDLTRVESDIESSGRPFSARLAYSSQRKPGYSRPQRLAEPIGRYLDEEIYRYAVIDGRTYQFDRVCPPEFGTALQERERYVAPGLIYLESRESVPLAVG